MDFIEQVARSIREEIIDRTGCPDYDVRVLGNYPSSAAGWRVLYKRRSVLVAAVGLRWGGIRESSIAPCRYPLEDPTGLPKAVEWLLGSP